MSNQVGRPAGMPETLLVVSHVVHYRHEGALLAYGPYAREVDIWADLFPRVVIAAPCREGPAPAHCIGFTRDNITIAPQIEAGGDTAAAKLRLLALLPALVWRLASAMTRADAIHVRCPGYLGLLGVALAPMFSRRLVAKYAGQWNSFGAESWPGRLEKRLLRSSWWRGPVTVYGEWDDQPAHVVPFFTSMMTSSQVAHAAAVATGRRAATPLKVLFAGLLEPRKRADALIEAVALASAAGMPLELVIVGDGPERARLIGLIQRHGLADRVRLVGALPFDEALTWYEWADCLVLPSRHSEGWPKVIAEAMSYGVVCIGVDHGQLRRMLEDRGILLREGSADEIAGALKALAAQRETYRRFSERSVAWAQQYSLDGLRDALARLLTERWQLPAALAADGTQAFAAIQPLPPRALATHER